MKAERVRLDVLLVERGLAETRAKAQGLILAGEVVVGEHRADKPGVRYAPTVDIRLKEGRTRFVSRGGEKLLAALTRHPRLTREQVAIDVGASTGGFTHVLLEAGVAQVYAVDVGYGQLHWTLREDPRVIVMERTHIGKIEADVLVPRPNLAVVDVSFISLTRVLPALVQLLSDPFRIIALIKPQFEVGPERIGKRGVVRDAAARDDAIQAVLNCATSLRLVPIEVMESPLRGAEGNVEFLVVLHGDEAASDNAGSGQAKENP